MKSFGVRFAAGAITILFGAYAAALAQKDKQNNLKLWSAKAPSLGEPATPIAEGPSEGDDESWLTAPSSNMEDAASRLAGSFESANPVQLVQHTETAEGDSEASAPAFDPSSLPATLGDETASASSDVAVPDWTLPAGQGGAEAQTVAETGPGLAMTFPADGPQQVAAEPQVAVGSQLPSEPQVAAQGSEANTLPSLQLGEAPNMNFDPAAQPAIEDPSQLAAAGDVPVSADGQPANMLRGSDSNINSLRNGDAPEMNLAELAETNFPGKSAAGDLPNSTQDPAAFGAPGLAQDAQAVSPGGPALMQSGPASQNTPNLAQNAPGFGVPAQQFDQPAQPFDQAAPYGQGQPLAQDATPNAALGSPQLGGYPQAINSNPSHFNNGQAPAAQNTTAPPPRMASLPREAGGGGYPGGYQPAPLDQPIAASPVDPDATIDLPGDRRLEGVQTPSVVIQKRAPAEVKVGKPASFVIHVQNVGSVEALDVQVHDRVPAGMRLVDASPAPVQQGNLLLWQLGAMPAGDERTVTMQLIPEQEGELGSVARVSFEAAASVRTISTRPELSIVQRAPETVLIGQQLEIELEVSNPGSGEATGVVLQEDVPEGLEHPQGRQLDNALGTLAPGEVRNQVLRLRAVEPGIIQNTIRLSGDDGLTAEHTVAVQVVAPQVQVELTGPSRRFLERQATYQLKLANVGTADATNVEVAVQLSRGFTFVSTDYEGQYDPSRHVVVWSLARLPAGGSGEVPLTLLPVEEGEQKIVIDARADLGVVAKSERNLTVEGFAELSFEITNAGGPIELGAETEYQIRVVNSGSKADSNVRLQLQLPPGLELVSADGEAGTDGRGLVAFQPKPQLSAGSEMKYGLRLRGVAPGTHVVRAVVVSDQSNVPVTKEESTLVYADQ